MVGGALALNHLAGRHAHFAGKSCSSSRPPWRDGTTHLVMSPLEFIKLLIQRPLCGRQIRRR
jgi:hypothetical protein